MINKLYMKNSDGRPSASLTMAWASFIIVTCWLMFWIIGTTFGLQVPEFDAAAAMGYMTPLLGLYFGRRWSEKGISSEVVDTKPPVEEETQEDEELTEESSDESVVESVSNGKN